MNTVEPTETGTTAGNPALLWVGTDNRGVELEVMPLCYRTCTWWCA